jgi:hypothetical protein
MEEDSHESLRIMEDGLKHRDVNEKTKTPLQNPTYISRDDTSK